MVNRKEGVDSKVCFYIYYDIYHDLLLYCSESIICTTLYN